MVRSEDLTETQRAALDAIVGGDLAWSPASDLWAAGHADALTELVALDLVVPWLIGPTLHYTLTPYGASVMRVHIIEQLSIIGEELEEDPFWIDIMREASSIVLPKRRHEIRWPWMEEIEDPKAKHPVEMLIDEVSGEPVLMFGQQVAIDRRLGKGGAKQPKRRRAG